MAPSRGFVTALSGLGITVFAWFSPWEWPGWPALTVLSMIRGYSEMSYNLRGVVIAFLIGVNVAFWGIVAYAIIRLIARLRRSERRLPGV